jgi:hypothetical protein
LWTDECGFAVIRDVETKVKDDRMESFALSETFKYLYLLFDEGLSSDKVCGLKFREFFESSGFEFCIYDGGTSDSSPCGNVTAEECFSRRKLPARGFTERQ